MKHLPLLSFLLIAATRLNAVAQAAPWRPPSELTLIRLHAPRLGISRESGRILGVRMDTLIFYSEAAVEQRVPFAEVRSLQTYMGNQGGLPRAIPVIARSADFVGWAKRSVPTIYSPNEPLISRKSPPQSSASNPRCT